MFFDLKNLDDILFLMDNKVSESITLDYKRQLPNLDVDSEKIEMLKDICAFANTHGGHLIYGIDEVKGIPTKLLGEEIVDIDKLKLRLTNIIKSGFDLGFNGFQIDTIPFDINNQKYFIIIKVSSSLSAPHRIKFKDFNRFYGRANVTNFELSFVDIRDKINMLHSCREKIIAFRENRVSQIYERKTPLELHSGAQLILHFLPLSAFATNDEVSMQELIDLYVVAQT